jgi:hypothetical protein
LGAVGCNKVTQPIANATQHSEISSCYFGRFACRAPAAGKLPKKRLKSKKRANWNRRINPIFMLQINPVFMLMPIDPNIKRGSIEAASFEDL